MIAIVSDIHGNLPALKAVLAKTDALGCARVISLGDVAGYYAQPGECIDLLREYRAVNILGNHDFYLVSGSACPRSKLVAEITEYHRKIVTTEQVAWLRQSPSHIIEGDRYFVHGGWKDHMDQYLYKLSISDFPEPAKYLFSGHTHVQALLPVQDKTYCNPGSVGQPRDGNPQAAFAVLTEEGVDLYRVEYDIDLTAFHMQKAGFSPHTYENLYIGAQIGGRIDTVILKET